jgi:uncharacterized protein YdaU (DUF1376 family)
LQHRRYSYPLIGKTNEEVLDPFFSNQMTRIKHAVIDEQFKDNVYAEAKKEDIFGRNHHIRKKKMVNRRTQTYLRELLQLDGEEL